MSSKSIQQPRQKHAAILLLDLPAGSHIRIDGQLLQLHRNDFVGVAGIPASVDNDSIMHFVATRPCLTKTGSDTQPSPQSLLASTATGFFWMPSSGANNDDGDEYHVFMRRYDPTTEEMSDSPAAIDTVTRTNLVQQVVSNLQTLDPQRFVPYTTGVMRNNVAHLQQWKTLTHYITPSVLQRRGLSVGNKIVPGGACYDNDDATPTSSPWNEDGRAAQYPPIPVFGDPTTTTTTTTEKTSTASSIRQHQGTKAYVQRLSPSERTQLLFPTMPTSTTVRNNHNTATSIHASVLHNVWQSEYNRDWNTVWGDLQLAFVLFVQLQCYTSWIHWRDLMTLLCRGVADVAGCGNDVNVPFLPDFVHLLLAQLEILMGNKDESLLEEQQEEGSFLPSAVQCLRHALLQRQQQQQQAQMTSGLATAQQSLDMFVQNHWPQLSMEVTAMETNNDTKASSVQDTDHCARTTIPMALDPQSDDDDDDDSPVVVPLEEMQAAEARTAAAARVPGVQSPASSSSTIALLRVRAQYPILYAAVQPHEDIVMTAARALEACNDVSLVREAAAYLEQVEAVVREED